METVLDLLNEINSDAVVTIWDSEELIRRMFKLVKFLIPSPDFRMELYYQPMHYLGDLYCYRKVCTQND